MKKLLLIFTLSLLAVSCNRTTPQPVNEQAANTNNTYKTYQDSDTGVEFRYPSNWEIIEPLDDNPFPKLPSARAVAYPQSPEVKSNDIEFALGAELSIYHQPSLTPDVKTETFPQGSQEQSFAAEGFMGAIRTDMGKVENGAVTNYDAGENIRAYKVFPNGEVVVIVWNRANLDNRPTDLSYQKYLLPILASINFINPSYNSITANWKILDHRAEYQSEYHLTLHYPPNWVSLCGRSDCSVGNKEPEGIIEQNSDLCYLSVDFPYEGSDWEVRTVNNFKDSAQKQNCQNNLDLINQSLNY